MGYMDQQNIKDLGFAPTESGVYPWVDGSGRFTGVYVFESGAQACMVTRDTEEAEAWIARNEASTVSFWDEKVELKAKGDKHGPTGVRNVLRIGGEHYVAQWEGIRKTKERESLGFGGRVFHWRFLDEPEGTVHVTNCMWAQGTIPADRRDELPDNAVFVPRPKN
jgi:hypothetical protein